MTKAYAYFDSIDVMPERRQEFREQINTLYALNDFKGDNGIKLHYGVKGIPNYFIISPEGKIIETWMGYGEGVLKKKMQEFIL
ncbi:hypothetical protein [Parabacteroides sp. PFB2-10]|uniref:hypothetical protein n=1 Tax=Parabacteroides sp. PFB2-10 TaxID=1742405 RepID=UPI0024737D94|nr:hypothetical protein [Parabacteroides sp. PFB2-10]